MIDSNNISTPYPCIFSLSASRRIIHYNISNLKIKSSHTHLCAPKRVYIYRQFQVRFAAPETACDPSRTDGLYFSSDGGREELHLTVVVNRSEVPCGSKVDERLNLADALNRAMLVLYI